MIIMRYVLFAGAMLMANVETGRADYGKVVEQSLVKRDLCRLAEHNRVLHDQKSNTVCLTGQITKEIARQFTALMVSPGTWVVVNSGGGDAEAALDIADWMIRSKARLIVDNLCFSACANYLFLAAVEKVVLPQSIVAWHGGPPHVPPPNVLPERHAHVRMLAARSDKLLEDLGVSTDLIYFPPYRNDGTMDRKQTSWTVRRDILESTYGVKGILYMWDPMSGLSGENTGGQSTFRFPSK